MSVSPSLEDFRQFYLAKSYDVIGQGTFRRHLCKCKEVGDPWAVRMSAGVNVVHVAVRHIQSRIAQIPKPRNTLLQQLCKDVMIGAQPPIRMYAGYTTCCLSCVNCNTCIDLTRPAKNSNPIHIHARFSHFFLMLWYCSKLEYVVRSCAKAWLENQSAQDPLNLDSDSTNFKSLCQIFTEDTKEYCGQLHQIFTKCFDHVNRTLDVLMHYSLEHRVLEPSRLESSCADDKNSSVK